MRYFAQLICEGRPWINESNNVKKATIMFRLMNTNNSNRYRQEKYANLKVFVHEPKRSKTKKKILQQRISRGLRSYNTFFYQQDRLGKKANQKKDSKLI